MGSSEYFFPAPAKLHRLLCSKDNSIGLTILGMLLCLIARQGDGSRQLISCSSLRLYYHNILILFLYVYSKSHNKLAERPILLFFFAR